MAFEAARLISGRSVPNLTLAEAYVAHVHPKHVGQLMKHLASELPLGPLQHLKRVRPAQPGQTAVEVLLCLKQEASAEQQHMDVSTAQLAPASADLAQQKQHVTPSDLPANAARVLASVTAELAVQRVPLTAPHNRQQWQEWCKIWPMPWRIPVGVTEQDGEQPTPSDQQYFEAHMTRALAASAAAGGKNVAIIVDPVSGAVLAHATDNSSCHPLDHAAMVAIEAVAARDRKLWPYNGFAHSGRHAEMPDDAGYVAVAPKQHVRPDSMQNPEEEGSRPPKKQKSEDGEPQQQQQQPQQTLAAAVHSDGAPADPAINGSADGLQPAAAAAANPTDSSSINWANKPYLCTGYDCFLLHEPCTMCAMALVHSRLARIVYCKQSSSHGALGGSYRLHGQRSLNHHYKVYHMPQKQQE